MQRMILVLGMIAVMLVPASVTAQHISGETEFGTGGGEDNLQSHQYLFVDWEHANALIRPFWVEGVLNRWEFAVGPTFNLGDVLFKTETGVTTDEQWMLGNVAIFSTLGLDFVHIADGKIGWGGGVTELYQKLFVNVTGLTRIQLRIASLVVEGDNVFLRVGPEYRHPIVTEGTHLFFNPFYETEGEKFGGIVGLRFGF